MNRTPAYFVGALLLIALGVVMLLMTLGVIKSGMDIVIGILFLAGGLIFLAVFAAQRHVHWWAVIPGMVLAAIGLLILFEDSLGAWAGALVVGSIALAFFIIYFNNRAFWWAIIPAGVMTTVTLLIGFSGADSRLDGDIFASLLFLGIGLTFLVVYFLPTPTGRMRWAIWPAAILLGIGVIISIATASALNWVWAVTLIAGGVYLIYRAVASPRT